MSAIVWSDERIAYAMELRYGEGLKWECIACLMNTSESMVRKAVRAAEQRGMHK